MKLWGAKIEIQMLFFKFVLKKREIDDRIYKNGKEWRINMIKNRLAKAATVAVLICTVFTVLFLLTGCSSALRLHSRHLTAMRPGVLLRHTVGGGEIFYNNILL